MKKCLLWGTMVLTLASCGQRRSAIDPFEPIREMVDSAALKADSLLPVEVVEESRPMEADELFDDFIFNYAQDERLQMRRTKFPLPYYKGDTPLKIEKEEWKHDELFSRDSCYTLLFDREEEMDLVGDTTLKSVQVEWFYLNEHRVKRYYFERINGMWMLEAINLREMERNAEEDFVSFYARFATDSVYQQNHIAQTLHFVTIDPDDDFSILETTLDAGQWEAFRPQLPADRLSNINYGQHNEDQSHTKIMKINDMGNGCSNVLYFRRKGNRWELYRYEDSSM